MMRRGRNQSHAGNGVTHLGDVLRHLVPGQLTAFTGLGPLRHLDLNLVGADQVLLRHAETAGGDLLDAASETVALFKRHLRHNAVLTENIRKRLACLYRALAETQLLGVTPRIFTAFAGIGLTADAVHCHSQCCVSFCGNRPKRHGARGKAADDVLCRFHRLERNRRTAFGLKAQQAAQRHLTAALVVDDAGVFLIGLVILFTRRFLQFDDRLRRPHVLFAFSAPRVLSAHVKFTLGVRINAVSGGVLVNGFLHDVKKPEALNTRGSSAEIPFHETAL